MFSKHISKISICYKMARLWLINLLCVIIISTVECHNKYSAEANLGDKNLTPPPSLKTLDKPFRMAKLNRLWGKAQIRLSEPKLKSLFGELKIHDKEEITWKRLKGEGKDKEGLKEAELRTKLLGIMNMYGLLEHFEDTQTPRTKDAQDKIFNEASDEHINKSLFKDKKLNKLWSKAEASGFSSQELQALREEFHHHQDKIDEYYSILRDTKEGPDDQDENSIDEKLEKFNSLNAEEQPNKDYLDKVNLLREKHRNLRDGYDRLHRLAAKGPNSKEFVEPKVQGLWKIALDSDFGVEELESLRTELLHYENRLLKLRHLQAEAALNEQRHKEKEKMAGAKTDGMLLMEDNIKKQARKVEKMHLDLETKIMLKHVEL